VLPVIKLSYALFAESATLSIDYHYGQRRPYPMAFASGSEGKKIVFLEAAQLKSLCNGAGG